MNAAKRKFPSLAPSSGESQMLALLTAKEIEKLMADPTHKVRNQRLLMEDAKFHDKKAGEIVPGWAHFNAR